VALTGKIATSDSTYDTSGYDLGTFSFEVVVSEPCESSQLIGPAKEQEFMTSNGAERTVTISGTYGASTWALLYKWEEDMEGLVTGSQYDDASPRFLALYHKDYYSAGVHLWALRDDPSKDQNSNQNKPIHVIVEEFSGRVSEGTSPEITYTLRVRQQVRYA